MSRCPVRNIVGQQCRLTADHPELALDHDYPSPPDPLAVQLEDAKRDLALLRASLERDAKHADEHHEQKSSAFWFASWTEANRKIAALLLEVERLKAVI